MSKSIGTRINALPPGTGRAELRALFECILADQAAMRTAYAALLAKLDVDTGVNSTDYAATATPPALTLLA